MDCTVEKAHITVKRQLKAILVKAQKRTEVEKACLPRENLSGHEQNRMLMEI